VRFLLVLILLSATALAEAQTTRYVTDEFRAAMRTGDSNQHRIISFVPAGTRVEVLEQNTESGYARVRTPQGGEGWILIQELQPTPIARDRLANAEQELTRQRAAVTQLREQNKTLGDEKAALEKEVERLTQAKQQLDQDVTQIRRTSASALALDDENKSLREQLSRLEREHQMVQHENQVLQDRTARDWFIVGAGVVLLGIVIGLIIPKIRWQRKSQWDRF
jgi:SH3 domain protein